jgi:hypothetical protein
MKMVSYKLSVIIRNNIKRFSREEFSGWFFLENIKWNAMIRAGAAAAANISPAICVLMRS